MLFRIQQSHLLNLFGSCIFKWQERESVKKYCGRNLFRKYLFTYLFIFFGIFNWILRFWFKITWFLSFSGENDAESLCHFVKIPFLDPKRAKLDQNSDFRHVRTCQDLSRRTSTYCKPAEMLLFFQIL